MNEDGPNSCMIINRSSLGSRTVATATQNNLQILQNDRVSILSTYESFCLFCFKTKRFMTRLASDLFISLIRNWFPNQVPFPSHIVDLFRAHDLLQIERETAITVTYSRIL